MCDEASLAYARDVSVDSIFVQVCADYGSREVIQKLTVPPGPSPDDPPRDRLSIDPYRPYTCGNNEASNLPLQSPGLAAWRAFHLYRLSAE